VGPFVPSAAPFVHTCAWQGSCLFTVGSVALYPSLDIASDGDQDWKYIAWVDYTFVIGAWCFTIGNFIIYHQVRKAPRRRARGNSPTALSLWRFLWPHIAARTQPPTALSLRRIALPPYSRRRPLCSHMCVVREQVINTEASHKKGKTRRKIRWFALPDWRHKGQVGVFFNCVGTLLFNVNTMTMFDWLADKTTTTGFNLWYVSTGTVGSACFMFGGIFEGEHNDWREISMKRFKELPFLMSILNFLGGLLFLIAYAVDVNRYADSLCEDGQCGVTAWVVCTPFTLGSIFFFIASWMSLWMWKKSEFGLGYSREMVGQEKYVRELASISLSSETREGSELTLGDELYQYSPCPCSSPMNPSAD